MCLFRVFPVNQYLIYFPFRCSSGIICSLKISFGEEPNIFYKHIYDLEYAKLNVVIYNNNEVQFFKINFEDMFKKIFICFVFARMFFHITLVLYIHAYVCNFLKKIICLTILYFINFIKVHVVVTRRGITLLKQTLYF